MVRTHRLKEAGLSKICTHMHLRLVPTQTHSHTIVIYRERTDNLEISHPQQPTNKSVTNILENRNAEFPQLKATKVEANREQTAVSHEANACDANISCNTT